LSSLANLKSLASANVFKYSWKASLVCTFKFHAQAKLSLVQLCQVWQILRVWPVQILRVHTHDFKYSIDASLVSMLK